MDSEKQERRKRWRESKAERADRIAREINEQVPQVDSGQFDELEAPASSKVSIEQVLRIGERLRQGLDLRQACVLEGATYESMRKAVRKYRRAQREEDFHVSKWTEAVGYTIERAFTLRILRWQLLAESGGKGSATALWMLERRGGTAYAPPTKHKHVTTENKTLNVNAQLSIEQSIEATQSALNLDPRILEQSGDYWAKLITANQRGEALPSPLVIEVEQDDE